MLFYTCTQFQTPSFCVTLKYDLMTQFKELTHFTHQVDLQLYFIIIIRINYGFVGHYGGPQEAALQD